MLQAPFEELVTSTSDVSALLAILPADRCAAPSKMVAGSHRLLRVIGLCILCCILSLFAMVSIGMGSLAA